MSRATFFVHACPTCGRRLKVRIEYLGKVLVCQHCRGTFRALDPANARQPMSDSGERLLERADDLLASNDQWRHRPR